MSTPVRALPAMSHSSNVPSPLSCTTTPACLPSWILICKDRLTTLADVHAGQSVARDVAFLQRSFPTVVYNNAGLLAIVDLTFMQDRLTTLADVHAGQSVARDVAFFHVPSPLSCTTTPACLPSWILHLHRIGFHPGRCPASQVVADDVAVFQRSFPAVVYNNTGLLAVVDLASAERWLTTLAYVHAGQLALPAT